MFYIEVIFRIELKRADEETTVDISEESVGIDKSAFNTVSLSYFFIAAKRHHDQGNLQREAFSWGLFRG